MAAIFDVTPTGIRLSVRVTPGASRDGISGIAADADGGKYLKIMVTAPAEGGKANAAVIKLLSKAWKVPKSAITVASGATGRRKTLIIAGDTDRLAAAIQLTIDNAGKST